MDPCGLRLQEEEEGASVSESLRAGSSTILTDFALPVGSADRGNIDEWGGQQILGRRGAAGGGRCCRGWGTERSLLDVTFITG